MIELVMGELQPEMDAYEDFCNFRESAQQSAGRPVAVSRSDWLDGRREALQSRMHRRRSKGGRSFLGE